MDRTVSLKFGWERLPLILSAPDNEPAYRVLERAYVEQVNGTLREDYPGPDSDWSGFLLQVDLVDASPSEIHYLPIDKDLSFGHFARLVGDSGERIVVTYGGEGGDGGTVEFVQWFLEDLLPPLSNGLAAYGGFDAEVKTKHALAKRLHREGRSLAEDWLATGDAPSPELLRLASSRQRWNSRDLQQVLGLDISAARPLMNLISYRWSEEERAYCRPVPWDAVN